MTKPTETLARIPLAKLYIAPENARFGSKELGDLDALGASIIAVGDLIDPLHAYGPDDAGNYGVWDGGRRWHALMKLVKAKKVPEALKAGAPCLVSESQEAAMLLSQATFVREQMHPADEFLHYKRLFDAGLDHERIAAVCAVPTPRVRQLLRLTGVAPAVLDAFRAGELALDVVEAFTLSADHAKQLSVLEGVRQRTKTPTAWMVKDAFRSDAVGPTDRWAVMVGREAYEAAGGTFLSDLFSRGKEDEEWADGNLVRSLAQQKINTMIAELEADGWGFAEFIPYDRAHHAWQKGHEQAKGPWSAETKATGGVFILQDWNGKIDVRKGWVKPKKEDRPAGAEPLPGEKPDPALYGWGHKGHGVLTQVATEATQVALLRNPEAAYDAMLTHLAWVTLRDLGGTDSTASKLIVDGQRWGAPEVEVEGAGEVDAAHAAWIARLGVHLGDRWNLKPEDRVAFCDAVAALTPEEKANLLAYCFGRSRGAFEDKSNNRRPSRWAHLGWIARRAGVDFDAAWAPDRDFIKGGSKDALVGALIESGWIGEGWRDDYAKKPKGELVEHLTLDGKGWRPKLLRDLVATPEAPKASKPKKARKPKADAPPPADPADDELPASVVAIATGRAKPITSDEADDAAA